MKEKLSLKNTLKSFFLITLGVLSATFGLKSFLLPEHFIDGGVTGISLLVSTLTGWNLSYLIIIINIPFIILGYHQIGKLFAFKTTLAIAALSIGLLILPFEPITHEKVLIAFFGGFFLGGGIGLAMRGGGVIDGTEVLALYISRNSRLTVGNIIFILNVIIFLFAAYFINIDTALYAILTYLSATNTVDFIVNRLEAYTGVTIISEENEAIKDFIITEMKRGVTIYKGKGGYQEQNDIDIIYTVVTKLELGKLQDKINEIDPSAFIVQQQISDIRGGVVKRQALH
ncbi:YitT family protein [Pedobacter montanisoli]|uniref:YitT family protein n=1 Tax=Pedobacter montanisoli TaxID=2923277 RepID=A0ABS9ZWI8_9SPHI|nr:YitT family protein [Pedobacter montanisoli]MCJ0742657.1 YitT family protein [Pedobacter montanisoli]